MPTGNFIVFPQDLFQDPLGAQVFGGLNSGTGMPLSGSLNNYRFRLPIKALGGLYARARQLRIFGDVQYLINPAVISEGPVNITLDAVSFDRVALSDETKLPRHCGWYGLVEELPGWVDGSGNPLDQGPRIEIHFGEDVPVIETVDDELYATMGGNTNGGPFIEFLGDSVMNGVAFGRNLTNDDACTITCTLPSTHLGSFDGTGATGFSLELGTVEAGYKILGSLTLEIKSFWEHDPEDGDGPLYDSVTGAWQRGGIDGPLDPKWLSKCYP